MIRYTLSALVGLAVALASTASAQPQAIGRTELQRHDLGISGREVVQVRVDFSPGAAAARHRHSGEEIVFVLRGSLECRIEGRPAVILNAGESLFIPSGADHEARAVGPGPASVLATYIVEKGRPLIAPVP